MPAIHLELLPVETFAGPARGAALASLQEVVRLDFRLSVEDHEALEALRYARRAILREEETLGLDPREPSLDSAVFSVEDVTWAVPRDQIDRCLDRMNELVARANRAIETLGRS